MPYYISDKQDDCSGWATVKENADGSYETIGCHDSKQGAVDQMIAVSLAEGIDPMGERKRDSNTVVIVDVDGTVLNGSEGIQKNIDFVNELGKTDFIHIVTGRLESDREKTANDLRAAGLIYNALTLNNTDMASPEYKKATAEEILKTKEVKLAIDNDENARAAYQSLGIETMNPSSISESANSRSKMKKIERRTFVVRDVEARQAEDGTMRLAGYAAVFNDSSVPLPFKESIAPGAFRKTLSETPDVRLLVNHEGLPLARTKNGTLTLTEDERGLYFSAELANTQEARDIHTLIARGDVDQMSFAFRVIRQKWSEDRSRRVLTEVSLSDGDVSVVTYPAYPTTTVEAREELRKAIDAVKEGREVTGESLVVLNSIFQDLSEGHDYIMKAVEMMAMLTGGEPEEEVEVEEPELELEPTEDSSRTISLRLARAIVNNTK